MDDVENFIMLSISIELLRGCSHPSLLRFLLLTSLHTERLYPLFDKYLIIKWWLLLT